MSVGYYYKMYESQLNDKIKYWQYHLKKNKKNEEKEVKKTPEKKKVAAKSMYMSNNPNSIVNTIDKLKLYLFQSEAAKTEVHHKKQSKKLGVKDHEIKVKSTKSISMYGTMKLTKTMTQKLKLQMTNSKSKSKSKSKQKSKSKIIKSKKSKEIKAAKASKQQKQQKDLKNEKKSPSKKVTKKKKQKSPSPTKCFSIRMQSPRVREQLQMTKVWPQTVNLKTQKSRFQTESTQFRLWQQHEQTRYNMKRKHTKTLNRYLKSFGTFLKGRNTQMKSASSYRNSYTAISLQTMIRSQQSKLLELRAELGRLKNSNNLNESLEVIISKVNENISSLKKIEYSEKEYNNPNIDGDQHLAQVKSFHNSTRSVNQNEQSFASDMPEIREPILMMDSLTISNDETSHMESKHIQIHEYDNLKEQSSINLLDSKFLNVTINNQSLQEQNPASTKKINAFLLKSPDSLLLNFQSQPSVLEEGKSQSKLLSEMSEEYVGPAICFTVNEVKYFPVEQRSQEQSLESQEFLMSDQSNHKLLNRINNILNDHAGKLAIEPSQCSERSCVTSQQNSQLCNLIVDELINQMIPILGNHQSLLEKLIEFYAQSYEQAELTLNEPITPISHTNEYLLQLTDHLLEQASKRYQLYDRLRNPLGVGPLVNLRYIRISLIEQYCLDVFDPYNEEDYQEKIDQEMADVEEKSEVLLKEHLDRFDQSFGNPELAEQIILNRCLYEAVNNILDNFRPFGSTGLPVFHFHQCQFQMPTLQVIKKKMKNQLQKYLNLRLGPIYQEKKPTFDHEIQIRNSLIAHNRLLRDQIEQDFKTQEQDSMQRYELMLMIENYLFSQESWTIHQFFKMRERR